jgi:cysteine-S-conjugate beta-lyase
VDAGTHAGRHVGPAVIEARGQAMAFDFDTEIDRRGTSSLKWDYEEQLAHATGLLPLWVADMDFRAPEVIVEAMRRRVEHGVFGYTLEPESWYGAAAAWQARRHGWQVKREWMIASPGVIPSLAAAILALTEPGDGVVVQPPVYHPFAVRARATGRRVVENPLRLEGSRWEMDLEDLERKIDERTRLLVLCSPHNPVGRVWSRETLARLCSICARRGVVIVSDEIHGDLVMPGFLHVPLASVSEEAAACSVTLVSATKTFNLAGMGGAIAIVPDRALRAKVDAQHHALFAGVANATAVAATEAAWRQGDAWLDELRMYLQANALFLTAALREKLPAVGVFPLEGTYLPLLDMRGLGLPDVEINRRLLHEAHVWLNEGAGFGSGGKGYQRINIACPRSILARAVDAMGAVLG